MKLSWAKIFALLFVGLLLYAIISAIIANDFRGNRREYSASDFKEVYVTISTQTTRREVTLNDSTFIRNFILKLNACTPIPQDKYKSDAIYSFTFKGKNEVTIDLLVEKNGSIVLRDVNSLFQRDKTFEGNSMQEFVDSVNKMKLKRLY